MIRFITTASEHFFQHQVGTSCTLSELPTQDRTILAYIDIRSTSQCRYRIYIAMDEPLLRQITELFLGEETPDEQTLQEMLLETTNMIVGSAKVLAEGSGSAFNIETPFLQEGQFSAIAYDEKCTLAIENNLMTIALKEL
ncbi:MAG: chemotaxis protein CheX [Sulfurimonas sp.]|nr:MAG: chemotaxis protein CheX [Sulfurimonas sp.]